MMADSIYNTPWRQTASAIYRMPADGRIWGTYEADVTKTLAYMKKKKAAGINLTLTHMLIAAVARAYRDDVPELNCFARRGKIIHRDSVGVFVSVDITESREMTGFLISRAEEKGIDEICGIMTEKVDQYRARNESGAVTTKYVFAKIPWLLRRPVFLVIRFILATLGLPIRVIKADPNSFGSVLISNIGTHGLQYGMAAILPVSNLPVVVLMGLLEKKPVVRNDRVVIRDMLPLSCTLDHRVCDGSMGGRLARAVQRYLLDPESLEDKHVKAPVGAKAGIK
jgi:pyruvate/2-oxoglutarate dehydrogenase complex dihydrolipoamide acyltransferase (E2) component